MLVHRMVKNVKNSKVLEKIRTRDFAPSNNKGKRRITCWCTEWSKMLKTASS